jgi:hypothetical protein
MEPLYYHAFAHQDSFDVRWIAARDRWSPSITNPRRPQRLGWLLQAGKITLDELAHDTIVTVTRSNTRLVPSRIVAWWRQWRPLTMWTVCHFALTSSGMKSVDVGARSGFGNTYLHLSKASPARIDVSLRRYPGGLDLSYTDLLPTSSFARFEELRGAGGYRSCSISSKRMRKELWGKRRSAASVVVHLLQCSTDLNGRRTGA